jgi:hypothetical protein
LHAQRKVTKRKGIPGARAPHSRSPDEAQRNPGMSGLVEKPRISLRYIRATTSIITLRPLRLCGKQIYLRQLFDSQQLEDVFLVQRL